MFFLNYYQGISRPKWQAILGLRPDSYAKCGQFSLGRKNLRIYEFNPISSNSPDNSYRLQLQGQCNNYSKLCNNDLLLESSYPLINGFRRAAEATLSGLVQGNLVSFSLHRGSKATSRSLRRGRLRSFRSYIEPEQSCFLRRWPPRQPLIPVKCSFLKRK